MVELTAEIVGSTVEPYAAVPTLSLRLRLTETAGLSVHAIALRAQVRIEPQRRRYSAPEAERLLELFGETPRWGETLRPFLWTHLSTMVSGFSGTTDVDLPMTITYDFEVTGAKYLHSLDGGEIPLVVLFSGTVFTKGGAGFVAEPVPWHLECKYGLPVALWREAMDRYFPNSGWLRLARSTIDDLVRFKTAQALPTWDQAIEALLKQAGEDGS
jgi:hypothetical protein